MNKLKEEGLNAQEFSNSLLEKIDYRLKELERVLNSSSNFKLLTRKKTAEVLNVDVSTLHNWNKKGILKPHQIGGRVFYRLEDIEKSLVELKVSGHE